MQKSEEAVQIHNAVTPSTNVRIMRWVSKAEFLVEFIVNYSEFAAVEFRVRPALPNSRDNFSQAW